MNSIYYPVSVCSSSTAGLSCSTLPFTRVALCASRRAVAPLCPTSSLWCGSRAFSSFPALLSPPLSSSPPLVENGSPRIPRILFFGGDLISVTVLHALCTRLRAIYNAGESAKAEGLHAVPPVTQKEDIRFPTHSPFSPLPLPLSSSSTDSLSSFLARHITVITPSLPSSLGAMSLDHVCHRFSRQYPVLRYAVQRGLTVVPVDHPKSLAKSTLLEELLLPELPLRWRRQESTSSSSSSSGLLLRDQFDVCVVVSFRYFLPRRLLRALPSPVLNVHPSLLPRYRGASPIFSTLLHRHREEEEEEVRMDAGVSPNVLDRLNPKGEEAMDIPKRGTSLPCLPSSGRGGGGVTIIELSAKQPIMDGGRILWQRRVPLDKQKTDLRTYFPLVAQLGAAGCCELIFGSRGGAKGNETSRTAETGPAGLEEKQRRDGVTDAVEGGSSPFLRASPEATSSPTSTTVPSPSPAIGEWKRERTEPALSSPDAPLHSSSSSATPTTPTLPTAITDAVIQRAFSYYVDLLQWHTPRTAHGHTWVQEVLTALHHWPPSPLGPWKASYDAPPFRSLSDGHRGGAGASPRENMAEGPASCTRVCDTTARPSLSHPSWSWGALYPLPLGSPHCDWPHSLQAAMAAATPQVYPAYAHYTDDPFHAPILPKDAALLRFPLISGTEAFSAWSAFVGAAGMFSTVQTALQKAFCPTGEEAFLRRGRRVVRDAQKKRTPKGRRSDGNPVSRREGDMGGWENGSAGSTMNIQDAERGETNVQAKGSEARHRATAAFYFMRSPFAKPGEEDRTPGASSSSVPPLPLEPFCFPSSVPTTSTDTFLDVAALLDEVWNDEGGSASGGLCPTCSFTEAVHPDLVSRAVQEELAGVEEAAWRACGGREAMVTQFSSSASCSCTRTWKRHERSGAAAPLPHPKGKKETPTGEDTGVSFSASSPPKREAVSFYFGGWHGSGGFGRERRGVLPLHPLPMLQKEQARRTTHGQDWWEGRKREGAEGPILGERAETYAYLPSTVPCLRQRVMEEAEACHGRGEETMRDDACSAWLVPGSAYFPRTDASLGAIKCKEGWFFWRAAHFAGAPTSAQPAHLLRKGLAMRCGTVYTNVFACGSHSLVSSSLSPST